MDQSLEYAIEDSTNPMFMGCKEVLIRRTIGRDDARVVIDLAEEKKASPEEGFVLLHINGRKRAQSIEHKLVGHFLDAASVELSRNDNAA